MLHRWALVLSSLGVGCRADLRLPEPPVDVRWLAAVFQDAGGALISASALTPYHPGGAASFNVPDATERLSLLAWPEDQLAPLWPEGQGPGPEPLTAAQGCAPRLPPPSWHAAVAGDGQELPAADPPSLGAPWIADCPSLPSVEIDLRCLEAACVPAMPWGLDRCQLTAALSPCLELTLAGSLDRRAGFCPDAPVAGCSALSQPVPGASASWVCASGPPCEVHLYAGTAPLEVQVDEVVVVPGIDPRGAGQGAVGRNRRRAGYFSDFAVLEDRVVVASHDGRYQPDSTCGGDRPMRVMLYDRAELSLVASATAPPCLMGLEVNPEAPGFVGFYRRAARWYAGLFAPGGQLVSSTALSFPDEDTRSYHLTATTTAAPTGEILAAFSDPGQGLVRERSVILALGGRPGAPVRRVVEVDNLITGFAVDPTGLLALDGEKGTLGTPDVGLFNYQTGQSLGAVDLLSTDSTTNVDLRYFPSAGAFLVAAPIERPVVYRFTPRDSSVSGRRLMLPHDFGPYALSTWPGDPEAALVASTFLDSRPAASGSLQGARALLALYDLRTNTFRPGALQLGYGVPAKARTAGGAVWISFPWEGRLRRIRPTASPR